jgi:hypothetical protein
MIRGPIQNTQKSTGWYSLFNAKYYLISSSRFAPTCDASAAGPHIAAASHAFSRFGFAPILVSCKKNEGLKKGSSGSRTAVRASSADRPVYPPLPTSCCAAANRRLGPGAASRAAKTIGRMEAGGSSRFRADEILVINPSLYTR